MQTSSILRPSSLLVATCVLLTMFVPLFAINVFSTVVERGVTGGEEVTVGIAVILRATARRLLRGASSNMLRTTIGAFGRTSARAATRRFVKFAGRILFSSVVHAADEADEPDDGPKPQSPLVQFASLTLGFLALCGSFYGILHVVPASVRDPLMGNLSMLEVVLLAGAPLLAYAFLHTILGRLCGVRVTYQTEFDGLLLQAYFTGAGSFLPLTTDVEYDGDDRGKSRLAILSVLGMWVLSMLATWLGAGQDLEALSFLGSMFLVYAFVYCFPIRPLEGHFIWAQSKLLWLLVASPILVSFLLNLDENFGEVL